MSELKYTSTHEWVKPSTDDLWVIGITEHAQELLGDMVFVELPEVGETFSAGDELGVVESVKAASDFYAPISGEVVAVNETLSNNPGLVNESPLAEGWLVKIKPSNLDEIKDLLDLAAYQQVIAEE
ncbi:glycine cleavage system protein GcvH [Legionella sp. W05-934-2]|jgi:glycine cleavage system H protein|uniref:glycine cleavage system protein GcvH n=1 Tax=Legionella sp. W05-934-2 TaxID=1198649 RepID=UPI00346266C7